MFVELGIPLSEANDDLGLAKIQKVTQMVQKCVYMYEGSVNKLLMNENHTAIIVVFGLPPLVHQDDAGRAILMSLLFIEEFQKISIECSIGVATGTVFSGVIGIVRGRREYSVFGDTVNLGARLMQEARTEVDNSKKVLCCQ